MAANRPKRQDSRWIVGGLTVLLLVVAAAYLFIRRSQELPADLSRQLLIQVFPIWYVNVLLIIAIIFVLMRNVFKLAVERRSRLLGSKFKVKLVATYFSLSLIPVLLLFVIASELLQGWGSRWFDQPALRQIIEQGNSMAQAMNDLTEETTRRSSERVLRQVETVDLSNPRLLPQLARKLNEELAETGLDLLAVYDGTEFVHGLLNPQSGLGDFPEHRPRLLEGALVSGFEREIRSVPQGRLVLVATANARSSPDQRPVVVGGRLLPSPIAAQNEQLIQNYQSYRQIEVQQQDIKTSYLLLFLMMTLLILLASTWVGLYLARRITVPIQALAAGTRRISQGDLNHRVDVEADDELGVLVGSFNLMTEELQRNKQELVATNRRLDDERSLFSKVLENVDTGVILVDARGRIAICNPAALEMLRLTSSEMIGATLEDAWGRGEHRKLLQLLERQDPSSEAATPISIEPVRLALGSEWRTLAVRASSMGEASTGAADTRNTTELGRILVLQDLSALIQAQQAGAWRDAARHVAHEIKNPLTPIKLASERLHRKAMADDPELAAAVRESTDIIVREVEEMRRLVDEFSRFARMRKAQPASTDLRRLVEETVHLYVGIKPGVDVAATVSDTAATAWLDKEQFRGVFINLLDNAVSAIEAPGAVEVSASRTNGCLEIAVTDDGPGIPNEIREKLFRPYFSTKGRGTGLGLAIVHRVVADHHGTIHVEPNRPHGTIFRIELPAE